MCATEEANGYGRRNGAHPEDLDTVALDGEVDFLRASNIRWGSVEGKGYRTRSARFGKITHHAEYQPH